MKFKDRNLQDIAKMVIGDAEHFTHRSSYYITQFFKECDLDFVHDGSARRTWTAQRLSELLDEPQPAPHALPVRFEHVLRWLMHKSDAEPDDPDRSLALEALNKPLSREGYEAFYGADNLLYVRHISTQTTPAFANPNRPFTAKEIEVEKGLIGYLDKCSEDELIEGVLLPLFRKLGFSRITAAGHKDKGLEYGKDVWMKFTLPTQHVLYFGIQVKKGKVDSSGVSRSGNANIAEIHNQVTMMLGHEIFDPDTNKKTLVDHAFIVAGGEITKQARNWLGSKLDNSKRSQILFMDRSDIVNLYVTSGLQLPVAEVPRILEGSNDSLPF